jgi:hypothetical protein
MTFSPSGSQLYIPALDCWIIPARSINRCDTIWASFGVSRRVGIKYWLKRMMLSLSSQFLLIGYLYRYFLIVTTKQTERQNVVYPCHQTDHQSWYHLRLPGIDATKPAADPYL